MKKISIKMKHQMVCALDQWLQSCIESETKNEAELSLSECCAIALIASWRLGKLHPKTHFYTTEKTAFKMDAATAFALLHLIDLYRLPATSYLGNELLKINNEINQFFK